MEGLTEAGALVAAGMAAGGVVMATRDAELRAKLRQLQKALDERRIVPPGEAGALREAFSCLRDTKQAASGLITAQDQLWQAVELLEARTAYNLSEPRQPPRDHSDAREERGAVLPRVEGFSPEDRELFASLLARESDRQHLQKILRTIFTVVLSVVGILGTIGTAIIVWAQIWQQGTS